MIPEGYYTRWTEQRIHYRLIEWWLYALGFNEHFPGFAMLNREQIEQLGRVLFLCWQLQYNVAPPIACRMAK